MGASGAGKSRKIGLFFVNFMLDWGHKEDGIDDPGDEIDDGGHKEDGIDDPGDAIDDEGHKEDGIDDWGHIEDGIDDPGFCEEEIDVWGYIEGAIIRCASDDGANGKWSAAGMDDLACDEDWNGERESDEEWINVSGNAFEEGMDDWGHVGE